LPPAAIDLAADALEQVELELLEARRNEQADLGWVDHLGLQTKIPRPRNRDKPATNQDWRDVDMQEPEHHFPRASTMLSACRTCGTV
jgi:hypothetical protein